MFKQSGRGVCKSLQRYCLTQDLHRYHIRGTRPSCRERPSKEEVEVEMLLRYCRIDYLCMGPNIIQDAFHELVQLRRMPAVFANVLQPINRNVNVMACCLF